MRKGILCLVLASLCSLPACSDDELDNDVASLLDGGVKVHVIVSLPQNDAGSSSSGGGEGGGASVVAADDVLPSWILSSPSLVDASSSDASPSPTIEGNVDSVVYLYPTDGGYVISSSDAGLIIDAGVDASDASFTIDASLTIDAASDACIPTSCTVLPKGYYGDDGCGNQIICPTCQDLCNNCQQSALDTCTNASSNCLDAGGIESCHSSCSLVQEACNNSCSSGDARCLASCLSAAGDCINSCPNGAFLSCVSSCDETARTICDSICNSCPTDGGN
jgi:hypothetical protein